MFAVRPLLLLAISGLATCSLRKEECMADLWKVGKLSSDMISVSSHTTEKAQIKYDGQGWCGDNTTNNWVKIDFTEPTIVHEIHIMNSNKTGNVRRIQFLTMFDRNTAWNQLVTNFDSELHSHSASILNAGGSNLIKLRINILSFDHSPCMRLQLFGCSPEDVCPFCQNGGQCLQDAACKCPYGFDGTHCETETSIPPPADGCMARQGLGDKSLSSDHLRVSSSAPNHTKDMGRLNYCCGGDAIGGWCPALTDHSPWYDVTFPSPVAFSGLEIQPPLMPGVLTPPAAYMKTFRLEIVLTEDSLKQWRVVAPSMEAISNSTIRQLLLSVTPHVAIDAMRIYPLTSQVHPCFRFDVLGCEPSKLCAVGFCKNGGTCVGQGLQCYEANNDCFRMNNYRQASDPHYDNPNLQHPRARDTGTYVTWSGNECEWHP